jgi:D-alanyl-lipoteichoic acid acyltransferase DltB (MBOAT superfamily)
LPVTLLVYWLLPRAVWRLAFLTFASWLFVAWYDWRFVPLMVGATTIDWVAGLLVGRGGTRARRRWILVVALVANVAILGYFKYRGFFLDSLDGLGSLFGLDLGLPALEVLLPLGISFYTFSAMSYVIDVYRGDLRATHSFLRYSAFIALLPRAIAGPILRYRDVEGTFEDAPRRLTSRLAALGLFFIACGMAKKLLIADVLLPHVDELFGDAAGLHFFSGWAAALG